MSRKVLSFDVGIVNLAYCILEISEDKQDFKINKWGIIDIATNRTLCTFIKRDGMICDKVATRVLNFNNTTKYYCTAHSSKAEIKINKCNITWTEGDGKCDMCDVKALHKCSYNNKSYCKTHHKKIKCMTKKCGEDISYMTDEMTGWCSEHYDKEYDSFVKKKTKKMHQNSNKMSLVTLGSTMFAKLDAIPEFLQVDDVLLENQPVHINPTMKTVSSMLFSYFIMRCYNEKEKTGSKVENLMFCSPSNKIKVGGDKAANKLEKSESNEVYQITKNLGMKYCKALINDNPEYLAILQSHKKQDDMCDAFLQGFITVFNNKIPQKYSDKLKGVNVDNVSKSKKKNHL